MIDPFDNVESGMESPLRNLFAITPHDTNNLEAVARAIYVGGTGSLKVETDGGQVITLTNLAAGIFHPIVVRKVLATGTTATGIIGGY